MAEAIKPCRMYPETKRKREREREREREKEKRKNNKKNTNEKCGRVTERREGSSWRPEIGGRRAIRELFGQSINNERWESVDVHRRPRRCRQNGKKKKKKKNKKKRKKKKENNDRNVRLPACAGRVIRDVSSSLQAGKQERYIDTTYAVIRLTPFRASAKSENEEKVRKRSVRKAATGKQGS